jgi:hypothetical protein
VQGGREQVVKQRKVTKKVTVKKKSAPKSRPKAARAKSGSAEREVHYSDLRKVMLASVLKRLT